MCGLRYESSRNRAVPEPFGAPGLPHWTVKIVVGDDESPYTSYPHNRPSGRSSDSDAWSVFHYHQSEHRHLSPLPRPTVCVDPTRYHHYRTPQASRGTLRDSPPGVLVTGFSDTEIAVSVRNTRHSVRRCPVGEKWQRRTNGAISSKNKLRTRPTGNKCTVNLLSPVVRLNLDFLNLTDYRKKSVIL